MISNIGKKFFKMAIGGSIKKETDVDITARCPVCGDSQRKKNSARLHLYEKSGVELIHCFNGDCELNTNKTMYSFLRDFYPEFLPQYKRETFGSRIEDLKSPAGNDLADLIKDLKTEKPKEKPVQTIDLKPFLTPLSESQEGINYLKNRGIEYKSDWYFGHQDLKIGDITYNITNSIVLPLYYNDEMYGFYSRSINTKNFVTFMQDVNIGYKIWNWFNVNLDEPVYIFEGIFDAISSGKKNIIALIGAKLPEERLKEIKYPVFCLDNDKTGMLNAIQYANKGARVYVQPNDIPEKDMNEIMLNHEDLNIPQMIDNNLHAGLSAVTRLKAKL